MFLSSLVTSHNETDSLDTLLSKLISYKKNNHEIVLLDDYSDNQKTISIIEKYKSSINFQQKKLQNDYGAHKNYGISLCKGEWIFQIDADELPTDILLENIDVLLESNSNNEALWLPRLNYFAGVTQADILSIMKVVPQSEKAKVRQSLSKIKQKRTIASNSNWMEKYSFLFSNQDDIQKTANKSSSEARKNRIKKMSR